jgi:hypothetical protein
MDVEDLRYGDFSNKRAAAAPGAFVDRLCFRREKVEFPPPFLIPRSGELDAAPAHHQNEAAVSAS